MGAIKRMDQIKTILKTYQSTQSVKATSRILGVSKNTVRTYLRLADQAPQGLQAVLDMPEDQFRTIFYAEQKMSNTASRKAQFEKQLDAWIHDLRKVGVTRHLLWEEYRRDHPQGYGYSQFCHHFQRSIARRDLTLALAHAPGEKMQVDFAGKPLNWVDAHTGQVHTCQVLVAVMPCSQYTFAIALPSQRTADFVNGLRAAMRYFGRCPKVIVSDNLKAFVIRADRYEPDFNELCVQLATHYEVELQAARAAKPKDKASVENAVGIAYSRLYAPLRNQTFHSPTSLNKALAEQLEAHNHKPFQKKKGSRTEAFLTLEYPLMKELPNQEFTLTSTAHAKVQRNYHVFLGQCKNFYSVPFQHVGSQATVLYSPEVVEIYIGPQRVATHPRLPAGSQYAYRTDQAHMPANHQQWREAEGYDAAYFITQANKVGPATTWAVGQILRSRIHEPQAYRSCLGALRLAKSYSPERLESAALRCQVAGKATYTMLRNILQKGLDQTPSSTDLFSPPRHENIRGSKAYQ
jgi:transposase